MNSVPPIVRYFVLCQDFLIGPQSPNDVSLIRLVFSIRVPEPRKFPFVLDEICAFAALANARGTGSIDVRIIEADTNEEVRRTASFPVDFAFDPLRVHGLPIRLQRCGFPRTGLYLVELRYNGQPIAQQELPVR